LRLFGPLEAAVHGAPLPRLRSRTGYRLLALLVLRHDCEVERDWLAGTLWPESSAAQASANLRETLKNLRHALGVEASRLASPTRHGLCLHLAGADVDLIAFDALVGRSDAASLEARVGLYRGPLLEGWSEEWVLPERRAREQAYLTTLEQLAAAASRRGDHSGASRWLRRVIAVDPLEESASRALMQVLAADGNSAAAIQVYRDLRLLLHRELNALPDPETTVLFQRLRAEARCRTQARASVRASPPGVSPADRAPEPPPPACDHNLPSQWTRFIGREQEMAQVKGLLAANRLLTLTGAGGCGKTRLALQIAANLLDDFPDGVWLVELAALADPSLVPQTVAAALGVREGGHHERSEGSRAPTTDPRAPNHRRPPTGMLIDTLRARELLLLLDNCEHLLAACAQLTESLLQACPRLRVLATSRESLRLPGEQTYRVPPLSVPDGGVLPPLERLGEYEAVQLFADRAVLSHAGFTVTAANAAAVARVCQRLDGIPLALELAAARVKALPVEQIAERLDDRFRLLSGVFSRTALPRHQTLRALIDWSHDLLSEPERTLLRRFSVFAGGWTLEAAEVVCSDRGSPGASSFRDPQSVIRNDEVLELLASLVEKSLVLYKEQEGEGRYWLLETVRQYARERLREAGEAEAVQERHRDWFLALAERAEPELWRESQAEWLDRLEREHDNLRAALAWTGAQGQGEAGLRFGWALWSYWRWRGHWTEAREQLAELLALPGAEARTAARAGALMTAGELAYEQGDYGAARALNEECLAIFRELGDKQKIAMSLNNLGDVASDQGEHRTARALYGECLAIFRELGHKHGMGWSLVHLGMLTRDQGDYAAARGLLDESLALFRELDHKVGIARSLSSLGKAAHAQEDYGAARALFEEAVAIARELGHKGAIVRDLEGLAAVAVAQGQPERAARLFGAVEALRAAMGYPLPPVQRAEHERSIAAVRAALGEATFAAAWAEGQAMPLEAAVADALNQAPGA
jgi:non-specific serine/threonine protein kinase